MSPLDLRTHAKSKWHYRLPSELPGSRIDWQVGGQLISGVIGFLAFACLIAFLTTRSSAGDQRTSNLLLKSHDVGTILQSLCLMPLAFVLGATARRDLPGSSRTMAVAAVTFLGLVVAFMLLSFAKVFADVLYMIPQGAVGGWLVAVCRRTSSGLPHGLRRLGIVAGVGLLVVGLFPIGYGLFVDPAIFHGPVSDDNPLPPGTDRANGIVHLVLAVGSLVGCTTYPLWAILAGRWLLAREDR